MKQYLCVLIVSCLSCISLAQDFSHEFGNVSTKELQLKRYEKDTIAQAVILYDIGKSYFSQTNNSFDLIFEKKTRIKILNKAGLDNAEILIRYYKGTDNEEKILEIKGNTYNLENGEVKISALNPGNTFNEKINNHWYKRKIAMPDVRIGSVIEFSYKIQSPYIFNLRNWDFQHTIPVIYSEYSTSMVPFYDYVSNLQGAAKCDEYTSYTDKGIPHYAFGLEYHESVFTYVMKNLPAFKDESFITTPDDYLIQLNFQLATVRQSDGTTREIMSTWPKLADEMLNAEKFGDYLKDSKNKGTKILETIDLIGLTKLEKATSIDRYVKSGFTWNGHTDKYTSSSLKDFLVSKTGNCTDINLFLAGMLNAAGIEAYPVLLSTRDNGKVKTTYPFLNYFNYVIVYAKIDSSIVLLDATEPLCKINEIPSRCLNDYGFIVQHKKEDEWVQFKSNYLSSIKREFSLTPVPGKDSISANCKLITTGYEAVNYRKKFTTGYDELRKKLLSDNSELKDSLHSKNIKEIGKPFEIVYGKKFQLETIENKIIITPFCNTVITENPLKMPVRIYPVDMIYKRGNMFQSAIDIPEGYKILTRPEDLNINNQMIKINYFTQMSNENKLLVVGTFKFKKDVYPISEYAVLKDCFDKIVDRFNEKIVLVKD